ncbi:hypothetical protein NFN56_004919, partial [Salmonella enterica]|nr:hypothetical protein [Salmonella enterica]EBC7007012.1 hypothetical protein [Salmonella enterica]EDF4572458.1 hypothetical protein [Salmonella enterica]EDY9877141.1 hypothetical protein [Salmonella enterica]EGJ1100083.1 hypothetical protein [Salmonella enterica]
MFSLCRGGVNTCGGTAAVGHPCGQTHARLLSGRYPFVFRTDIR